MKNKISLQSIIIFMFLFLFSGRIFADGFIVVPVVPRREIGSFPLEVKYHRVNVEIKEQTAVTSIDQEFYNPTGVRLEGWYIFPIPENASIKEFSMFINGKETEAELLDAKKARETYEDIVRKALDPALLEYQGRGIFKARIFPIEPYGTKRVKISYNEILEKDNGTIEYIYPLNTEKFSAKALKDVSVNVDIKSDDILKNIYCTTNNVDIVRKDNHHAVVAYEQRDVKPDADFKLYYNTDKSKIGLSVLCYREKGSDGYFFLSASPGFDVQGSSVNEKDITFILDVSGSMAGEKLDQAKKALLFCINNFNTGDHFQIIRFSTEAETLFDSMADSKKENIVRAEKFVNNLKAVGGTNIEEALSLALSMKESGRPNMIVFITDGQPTIGETNEDKLITKIKNANKPKARIFTFGVGYDINTHLLDKITAETKAYRSYITPKEDIEVKISGFYTKIQSSVLTDLKLTFGDVKTSKIYPEDLPDIFKGSSLTVLGSYSGSGNALVTLEGRVKDKIQKFEFNISFPEEETRNDFIPYLWGTRHVGYLLDQIRLNGEDKELVGEITEIARKYGIVTPYTSYLILEDETRRVSQGSLRIEDQTLGQIARESKDFGKKSESEYMGMKQKSGAGSVRSSSELQTLNKADNIAAAQASSPLVLNDKAGNELKITSQIKNIEGRAFYYSNGQWTDSMLQKKKGKPVRIQFAGKEYFDLLKRNPGISRYYSLGKNVRFIFENMAYEVYE